MSGERDAANRAIGSACLSFRIRVAFSAGLRWPLFGVRRVVCKSVEERMYLVLCATNRYDFSQLSEICDAG